MTNAVRGPYIVPNSTTVPTYHVKICFATSRNTVVKRAPRNAWEVLTLLLGKKIYITVTVKRTAKKGTTYRMRKPVIIPILNSGKTCLIVFRSGISDVATKEITIMIMISVTMINERIIDQKKALFFFTLKIIFNAFSIEEKT